MTATPVVAYQRASRLAIGVVALAAVGLAIAGYLLAVRMAGGVPVCGPGGGCEVVQTSRYAELFGIPVAGYGVAYSLVVLGAGIAWWWSGDRRGLIVAYALGILGTLFVVYLSYLELFVIEAICVWCAVYGATVLAGFAVAAVAVRRSDAG